MKTTKGILLLAAAGIAACVQATVPQGGRVTTVDGLGVGSARVECAKPDGWRFAVTGVKSAGGLDEFTVELTRPSAAVPPPFTVAFDVPQLDAHHKWDGRLERVIMPPDWDCRHVSRLCSMLPLAAFLNDDDRNRVLACASEAKRMVGVSAGLREEDCRITWKFEFFSEPEAPLDRYSVKLRIDRRDVFFGRAIAEGTEWIERSAGLKTVEASAAAFEPLYSAWYSFHQNVSDREIEAECAEAAKLGMKVLIVDDGWQTDDNNRGYAFCGDWNVSKRRFPDFRAHVDRVHALGLKYVIWYSVPFVGFKSANYERFKGKYLYDNKGMGASVLDPRFPEVRTFLCGIYGKAMREWDLDGLKLDFIDAFGFSGEDPAVKENYAGRDVRSLSEAIDVLMREATAAIRSVKPEALIEFRQSYVGPVIRQYGNMIRAADCPGDLLANRCRTANLRFTSGKSAVHSDMLEWNAAETPENAARYVLASLFSTIQYSVMLRTLPESHRRMIAHWLGFSKDHRETLLKGEFRPHHFEANYPWIEAESAAERIVAAYVGGVCVKTGAADRPVYLVNATGRAGVLAELAAKPSKVEFFDVFGGKSGETRSAAGLVRLDVPASGYAKITW